MRSFVLDTNILVAYFKADRTILKKISEENRLDEDDAFIMISSISKGEILSIALQNNWGERKVETLNSLLTQFIIIDVTGDNEVLLNSYAQIDA